MKNDSPSLGKDKNHIAAKLLTLALEIIDLLTGEEHTVVSKVSGECLSGRWSRSQEAITSLPHSPIHEKKILEVTDKITELLTGEVPLRCQDVTVYFSLEEWEYLGRHPGRYKDLLMGSCRPPSLQDGSSRGNSPERCPTPLFSLDCSEENVLDNQQDTDLIDIKVEVIDDDEEPEVMAEQQYGLRGRNPPDKRPAPMYSQDCPERHQGGDLTDNTVQDEEERMMGDHPCRRNMEAEIPGDKTTGKCSDRSDGDVVLSLNCKTEEATMPHSSGENLVILDAQAAFPTPELSCNPHQSQIVTSSLKGSKRSQLSKCEKNQFPQSPGLLTNKRSHAGKKTYPCLECGRCFPQKSNLVTHGRTHTGEKPFPCSECGKYFTHKSSLVVHKFIHTGERPFSCSECERCFTHKSSLIKHERSHRGEKPFSCSLCGKCFTRRSGLNQHEKRHKGEKPYSCSECGKCFTDRSNFVTHQRIHTGEKPFTCSECGKRFTNKAHLVLHERSHTGEKPFSCPECGKRYRDKSRLVKHERSHTGEKPHSCSECGSCFTDKSALIRHQRTHAGEAL